MDKPEGITCRELVELVTDYLEDTMPPDDSARFNEHLRVCGGCHIYVDQMRQTIQLTGALTPESISPEAEQELINIFRDWKK